MKKLKICQCKLLQYNAINVVDNLPGCFFTPKTLDKKKAIIIAGTDVDFGGARGVPPWV